MSEVEDNTPAEPLAPPQAEIRRLGRDVSLIASPSRADRSLAAAIAVAENGLDVEVVVVEIMYEDGEIELDHEGIVRSVMKTKNAAVFLDDRALAAELACRIHERLFSELERPVRRVDDADALEETLRDVTR
jgi:acetoin:2,6-dichlorophenolindophenol oxidoreductase subunit beta